MVKRMDLHGASVWLSQASRFMTMAWAVEFSAPHGTHWFSEGIRDLEQAVSALGYDLVKRQTPAEAHEAAIARFRSEDDGGAGR